LSEFTAKLNNKNRILSGGFLYMSDIIFSSEMAWKIGKIFVSRFMDKKPDYIITMETKGIPIAMMTARAFNIPLIAIRRNNRVTEGSVVSINYISGSSRKIQAMSLSRRALPEGVKVVIIDDFMKAGGTARGMIDLMTEFKVDVKGIGILVETAEPEKKMIEDYLSLLRLEEVDFVRKRVKVVPNI
jgi:purine operon repressor